MKVPVKKYSVMDWIRNAKNTELTRSCVIFCLWFLSSLSILFKNSRCKRKKNELVNAQPCVCLCAYTLTWSSETT